MRSELADVPAVRLNRDSKVAASAGAASGTRHFELNEGRPVRRDLALAYAEETLAAAEGQESVAGEDFAMEGFDIQELERVAEPGIFTREPCANGPRAGDFLAGRGVKAPGGGEARAHVEKDDGGHGSGSIFQNEHASRGVGEGLGKPFRVDRGIDFAIEGHDGADTRVISPVVETRGIGEGGGAEMVADGFRQHGQNSSRMR